VTCLSSPNTTCGQRAMEGELIEEGLTSPRCLPVIGLPAKKKKKEVEEEEEKKQWANKKDMKKPFGRHDPSPKDSALLNGVATYAVYFLLARSLLRRGPRCGFVFFSFAFLYFFFPSSCFPSNLKPQTQWLLLHQVIQPASHPLVFLCSLSNFCDTWSFFFFFLILMLLLMPHFAVLAAPAAPAAPPPWAVAIQQQIQQMQQVEQQMRQVQQQMQNVSVSSRCALCPFVSPFLLFFPPAPENLRESGAVPDYELPDPLARPSPDLCKWDSSFSTHWVSLLPKMTSTCWSSTWASSPAAGDTKKQRRVLGCHELGMLEARRLTPRRNNRKERKTHHFLLLIHLVSILFTKYQPGRVSHEFTRNEVNQDESRGSGRSRLPRGSRRFSSSSFPACFFWDSECLLQKSCPGIRMTTVLNSWEQTSISWI